MKSFNKISIKLVMLMTMSLISAHRVLADEPAASVDYLSVLRKFFTSQKLELQIDGKILTTSFFGRNTIATLATGVSAEKTVTVKNIGTGTINLDNLHLTGSDSIKIKQGSFSAKSIAPNETATFTLELNPKYPGRYSANFKLSGRSVFRYSLPSVWIQADPVPKLAVYDGAAFVPSKSAVSLGTVKAGMPLQHTFTLKNEGTVNVQIPSAFIFSNQFRFVKIPAPYLTPGSSCEMTIEFKSADAGTVESALIIGSLTPSTTNYVIRLSVNVIADSSLKVLDLTQLNAGATEEESLIPNTPDRTSDISVLGFANVGDRNMSGDFRLLNSGTQPLTIKSLKNILPAESANIVKVGLIVDGELVATGGTAQLARRKVAKAGPGPQGATLPLILQAGQYRDIRVEVVPNQNWLVRGAIQVSTSDAQTPFYEFNVAASVAGARGLLCSGDNNNWVASDFSCQGKANGTICGSTLTEEKTKICNQNQCVLMGDLNSDGFVDGADLEPFVKMKSGFLPVNLAADISCSGNLSTMTQSQIEGFASILTDSFDKEAFNTRVVELCTHRDLSNDPTRGRALVYRDGPINFEAMKASSSDGMIHYDTPIIPNEPTEVCVDNLGLYDLNGNFTGGNNGIANGKYTYTGVTALNQPTDNLLRFGAYKNLQNDFRFSLFGDDGLNTPREAVMRAGAVQLYHDISRFRNTIVNDGFIEALKLSPEIRANLISRQGRPDLIMKTPLRPSRPVSTTLERFDQTGIELFPEINQMQVGTRIRAKTNAEDFSNLPPISLALDPSYASSDFAGMMFFWLTANNNWSSYTEAFFGDNDAWKTNIIPAINDGLSNWEAFRISGKTEIFRSADYMLRVWSSEGGCRNGSLPCDKGRNIRNVLLYDSSLSHPRTTFPFKKPPQFFNGAGQYDGPAGSDLSALFFAGLFYDLSKEAGLGDRNADLLFWKTVSMIDNPTQLSMNQFGQKVLDAAAVLFPESGNTGKSIYDDEIKMTLYSRGITLNDSLAISDVLPAAAQGLEGQDFASPNPNYQPDPLDYGQEIITLGQYSHPVGAEMMQLQFMKHSKLGPCDSLTLTDGTFDTQGNYLNNGTYLKVLKTESPDESIVDLGNSFVVVPGNRLSWKNSAKRCASEFEGFYAEDLTSVGFRVVNVIADPFKLSMTKVNGDQYRINVTTKNTKGAYKVEIAQPGETSSAELTSGESLRLNPSKPIRLKLISPTGQKILMSGSANQFIGGSQ